MKEKDDLRSALKELAVAVARYSEPQSSDLSASNMLAEEDDPLNWFSPFVSEDDDQIFVFGTAS